MQHDTFIGQVQARAGLSSRGEAGTATRATLETLAERIQATQAEHLAAQLPTEIGEHLRRVVLAQDEPVSGARMTRHEFFDRVEQRSGLHPAKAVFAARCVMEVVGEATEGHLLEKIRGSLDEQLAETLFAGSMGMAH